MSGYVEAEGRYNITGARQEVVFSVGQNQDKWLLEEIKKELGMETVESVEKSVEGGHYMIQAGGKERVKGILEYFTKYPHLGQKRVRLEQAKAG